MHDEIIAYFHLFEFALLSYPSSYFIFRLLRLLSLYLAWCQTLPLTSVCGLYL